MHFSRILPLLLSSLGCASIEPEQTCKCLPSDYCWPSSDDWTQLNATTNGRLLRPKPPASVCYPEEPNYDAAACEDVIKHWTSSAWHADDPISPSSPPSDACYPIYTNGTSTAGDPTTGARGCDASSYPVYVVNASSAQDVQAGVNFARKHSVRLNVKNTGHGCSSIPGSLSIWTHHFREKIFHKSFVPEGCTNGTNGILAITFGAGTMDREAFEFAAEHDVVVVGGTDGTVGLVGWGSAGGHGYLTGSYGMGADNFVEATVVTPQGDIIVANEYQNADIFWAIRGGGGGTWGVITSITVNAYPMPTALMWSLGLTPRNATENSEWFEVVSRIFSELPQLKASGLQGYITVPSAPRGLTNAMFAYDQSKEMVEATIEPVLEYLRTQDSSIEVDSKVMSFPKWIDVYHLFNLTQATASGSGSISASRLLPADALTEDKEGFTRFLEAALPDASEINPASGGRRIAATMASPSKHFDNALNPAWRNTTVHLLVQDSWAASTQEENATDLTQSMSAVAYNLRQLAPDSGAYINERGDFVPDWQKTLYGGNYARLLSIKHKYDPNGVQWCEGCVASDEWTERLDGRFCKEVWA